MLRFLIQNNITHIRVSQVLFMIYFILNYTYLYGIINLFYYERRPNMGLNDFIKFGDYLKKIRLDNNLTQKEFAEKLGVKTSTYSNYEKNLREPSSEFINTLANKFNIDLFELLKGDVSYSITADENGIKATYIPTPSSVKEDFNRFLNNYIRLQASKGIELGYLLPMDQEYLLKICCGLIKNTLEYRNSLPFDEIEKALSQDKEH